MKICARSAFLLMLQLIVARSFSFQSQIRSSSASKAFSHRRAVGGLVARYLSSQSEGESDKNANVETKDHLLEEYRNKNNIRDQVFSAISADGSVKVTACTCRNLINDLMIAHTMTATPADALGRSIACVLMMSNGMQAEQTLQVTLKCKA